MTTEKASAGDLGRCERVRIPNEAKEEFVTDSFNAARQSPADIKSEIDGLQQPLAAASVPTSENVPTIHYLDMGYIGTCGAHFQVPCNWNGEFLHPQSP